MQKRTTARRRPVAEGRARSKRIAMESTATIQLRSPARKFVAVRHLVRHPTFGKPKRIHPRRVVPLVAEGDETDFHSRSLQAAFRAAPGRATAMTAPAAGSDELRLVKDTELTSPAAQETASNVDEPSAAINGQVVFYTGNWYAAVSVDGGDTFQFIDPATAFRDFDPPGATFCCDQVVHYIDKIDTFVWLLQYGPDRGDNFQRLAFARTADVAQGRWKLYDITTRALGVRGAFLDFPDLAVGAGALYVTTNVFMPDESAGSAVVRIPFSGIAAGKITAQRFVTMRMFSLRVAQNCGTTAFFAAHADTSTMRVFSWPEKAKRPSSKTVKVARFIGGNGYHSRTPDGRRWLDRADSRITGATLAGAHLYFAWGVDRGSNHRPKPCVQIAKIDVTTMTVLENINVFDPESATCYAALSTNSNGEVGISYMLGGGPRFPTHVVGILTGGRQDQIVAASDRGPLPAPDTGKMEWGDYLTVRRCFPKQKLFAATGYTLKGPGSGTNADATPRFVLFGRFRDA